MRTVIGNAGKNTAKASKTGYYLSLRSPKNSTAQRVGRQAVPKIRIKHSAVGVARVAIPAFIAPGSYFLIACADDARQVKESNERNNCRAAAGKVVVAPPAAIVPPEPAPAETPTTPAPTPAPDTGVGTTADGTAPTFAGATIVDQPTSSSLRVNWGPASDETTPQGQIIYRICWAVDAACASTFPTMATTTAGATSYVASGLQSAHVCSFVVRAVDAAGNADAN